MEMTKIEIPNSACKGMDQKAFPMGQISRKEWKCVRPSRKQMGVCGYNILGKRNRKCKGMTRLENYLLFYLMPEPLSWNKPTEIGKSRIMNARPEPGLHMNNRQY